VSEADYVDEDLDLEGLAAEYECDMVVGDERTLLLDLDDDWALAQYGKTADIVERQHKFSKVEKWRSRGGAGWHFVITLDQPVDNVVERILLQSTLGSDQKRELLSLYRVRRGHKTPSVLFKPRKESQ
jgi:hypothetical protein